MDEQTREGIGAIAAGPKKTANMTRDGRSWRRILPLTFILSSLVALVVLPIWTKRRTDAMRHEISATIEPASKIADDIQTILSTELSLIISYQVTEQGHFAALYRQASREEEMASEKLQPTVRSLGGDVAGRFQEAEAAVKRWHAAVQEGELVSRTLPSPVFLQRLFERRPRHQEAQAAVQELEKAFQAEVQIRYGEIAGVEGTNVLLSTILTLLALGSAVMVAWLGHQMRTLAREAERRRGEADAEAIVARSARAQAEGAESRAAFLSEASRELTASLDDGTILQRIARIAVPRLADFTLVDAVDEAKNVVRIAVAHRASKEPLLQVASSAPPYAGSALFQDVLSGKQAHGPTAYRAEDFPIVGPEADPRALEFLSPRSLLIIPILSKRGATGAVTFVMAESRRDFTPDEVELAEELIRRATLAAENARLYGESQQALRSREEILAIVSHDLRSPLTTISMTASVLKEMPPTAEELPQHLEVIRVAARRMTHLIQDLLDVTRIDSGHRLPIEPQPCPVGPLVEEVLHIFGRQAESHTITLDSSVSDAELLLHGDRNRLIQAISNLLGNALKFTPPGGRVELEVSRVDSQARFAIRDNGPGIADENLSRIFDPYWQMNRNSRAGAGLGLPIAKGIVQSHGGRIWVESEIGKGTTFYFTIPLAQSGSSGMVS